MSKKNPIKKENLPGYKEYPENEDIYSKFKEEHIDPDNLAEKISHKVEPDNKLINPVPESDELDIPGAELDDSEEAVGSEDEENNYYSLGGDNHADLEEDKGD